jgi:hypothetical protein
VIVENTEFEPAVPFGSPAQVAEPPPPTVTGYVIAEIVKPVGATKGLAV